MNPMPDYETRLGPARLRGQILMSRPPLVPVYRVGERFRASRKSWPEAAEYSFGPSGHELTLFRPEIGRGLIEDVRSGPAEFALTVEAPIIVLGYRFGDGPWGDAPYCWHLQPESRQVIPSREPHREVRTLLWVTLVGGRDGIIHAQRGLTLGPDFSGTLHEAIRSQAMRAFNPRQCVTAVRSISAGRGTVEALIGRASARTVGNS